MSDAPTWLNFVSGALGAGLGGFVTVWVATRKTQAEQVTAERTKWREKIRQLAKETTKADANSLVWFELALNTNPHDENDMSLVRAAKDVVGRAPNESELVELADRFSLLLKHDWDRAKAEVSIFGIPPHRVSLKSYRETPRKYWSGQTPY